MEIKRFNQIIISPGIETVNTVLQPIVSSKKQNRTLIIAATEFFKQLQSRFFRQIDIQNHQVIRSGGQSNLSILGRLAPVDSKSGFQTLSSCFSKLDIIFNQKNSHKLKVLNYVRLSTIIIILLDLCKGGFYFLSSATVSNRAQWTIRCPQGLFQIGTSFSVTLLLQ